MTPSVYTTCLKYTKKFLAKSSQSHGVPRSVACLRTYDTMYMCKKAFSDTKEQTSKNFNCKEAKLVKNYTSLKFNGAIISQDNRNYTIAQAEHIKKLNTLGISNASAADFVAERALGAYIAAVCRSDVTYGFSAASQITIPEVKDFKVLKKAIDSTIKTKARKLLFLLLDLDSIFMAVFVNAGFATDSDSSPQPRSILTLFGARDRANIIYYSSIKFKGVTESVLPAEIFATVHRFDVSSTTRLVIKNMLDRVIPLCVYTDARSLNDCPTRIN